MIRYILFRVNTILLKLSSGKKVKKNRGNLNINLGCGLTVASGWINIDGSLSCLVSKMPKFVKKISYGFSNVKNNDNFTKEKYISLLSKHEFVHHNLSKSIPIYDNKVEHAFSSHFLEHLKKNDAAHFLEEIYRVLKPGGRLRLSIPDLEYAIKLYPKNKYEMLDKYFFIQDDANEYSTHKYMYDFEIIRQILKETGFTNIRRSKYKDSDFPDCHKLDNREFDSLFIEASK